MYSLPPLDDFYKEDDVIPSPGGRVSGHTGGAALVTLMMPVGAALATRKVHARSVSELRQAASRVSGIDQSQLVLVLLEEGRLIRVPDDGALGSLGLLPQCTVQVLSRKAADDEMIAPWRHRKAPAGSAAAIGVSGGGTAVLTTPTAAAPSAMISADTAATPTTAPARGSGTHPAPATTSSATTKPAHLSLVDVATPTGGSACGPCVLALTRVVYRLGSAWGACVLALTCRLDAQTGINRLRILSQKYGEDPDLVPSSMEGGAALCYCCCCRSHHRALTLTLTTLQLCCSSPCPHADPHSDTVALINVRPSSRHPHRTSPLVEGARPAGS